MPKYKYRIKGLSGEIFLPKESEHYKVAVFCNGFPGSIGEHIIIKELMELGFAVIQPQYPGVYDSDGSFTVESAVSSIESISKLVDMNGFVDIKKGKKIRLPVSISLLAGHSFGCLIAARAANILNNVLAMALFAPILGYATKPYDFGVREDGIFQLEYILKSRPHTYRLSDIDGWRKLFKGDLGKKIIGRDEPINRVLGIVGSDDSDFDVEVLQKNFDKCLNLVCDKVNKTKLYIVSSVGHGKEELMSNIETKSLLKWCVNE